MTLKADAHHLAKDVLVGSDWQAIMDLSTAANDFQPLSKRGVMAEIVRTRLARMGISEVGECTVAGDGRAREMGYRLSDLGWALFNRGSTSVLIRPKRIAGALN